MRTCGRWLSRFIVVVAVLEPGGRLRAEAQDRAGSEVRSAESSRRPTLSTQPSSLSAQPFEHLGRVTGAVWVPEQKIFVLVGDGEPKAPPLRTELVAFALRCAWANPPIEPMFSLDPAEPQNPDGPHLRKVYIPDALKGTAGAELMFQADWLLKTYAFGVYASFSGELERDADGAPKQRISRVKGLKDQAQLTLERGRAGELRRARMWIVVDRAVIETGDNAARIVNLALRVKAKKQVRGPDGKLQDVDDQEDKLANQFADDFTRLYDRIAEEEPVFARLKELSKVMALARWLRDASAAVELEWAERESLLRSPVVGIVNALDVTREKRSTLPGGTVTRREGNRIITEQRVIQQTQQVRLFGGVDLTVKPQYDRRSSGPVTQMEVAVRQALATTAGPPVPFGRIEAERTLQMAVVPCTPAGRGIYDPVIVRPPPPPVGQAPGPTPLAGSPGNQKDPSNRRPRVVRFRRAGEGWALQVGNGPQQEWPELSDLLEQVGPVDRLIPEGAAGRPKNPAAAQILNRWRELCGPLDGNVVLLLHNASDAIPNRLSSILRALFPKTRFITTSNAPQAMKNLQAVEPIYKDGKVNLQVWRVDESLSEAQRRQIETPEVSGLPIATSVLELSEQSNVLVIYGDLGEPLLRAVDTAGVANKLRSKAIIMGGTCGQPDLQDQAIDLIQRHGATLVVYYSRPVDFTALPHMLTALPGVLKENPAATAPELPKLVIEKAISNLQSLLQRPDEKVDRTPRQLLQKTLDFLKSLLEVEIRAERPRQTGEDEPPVC